MKARPGKPPTSSDLDRIDVELRYAGDREDMISMLAKIDSHLETLDIPAEYRNFIELGRAAKRDFAQRLSTCLGDSEQ
jgi:hypothetical protein